MNFINFIFYILRYTKFVYSLYLITKNKTSKNIEYVRYCANICGPLAIKLLQLIISSFPDILKTDQLNYVFEDNLIHDHNLTEQMYLEDFGHSIHEDYAFNSGKIIGSGSIGQVYKCICRSTQKKVAIKVKHPNINKNVDDTVYALKIVCWLFQSVNKYHSIFMEYINNIYLQIDYIQEAKNTQKLKYNFRNETILVIPEIYKFTSNFIIMSYHKSKKFEDMDEQSQITASMYMNFIYLTSILVHDFLHADLHNGNWKIIEENGIIKIFIFDCGIMCITGDIQLNQNIMDIASSGRRSLNKLFDIIIKYDPKVSKIINKHLPEFEKITQSTYENCSNTQCFSLFLRKIIDLRILTNKNLINFFTSIVIVGDAPKKSIAIFTKYIIYPCGTNALLYNIYIGILSKMNEFNEFKNYLIEYLDNAPEKKQLYQNWLYQEFGHKKGYILTDIIYYQFFPKTTQII